VKIDWRSAWRLARRDLNRSLQGLRLLFLCISLGVATLAGIGSLTSGITSEIAERGRVILGGDVQVSMSQRQATPDELQALRAAGEVSETVRMRAMARRGGDRPAVLTELKGVDAPYPLYGSLTVGGQSVRAPAADKVYIVPELADRLGIARGGVVRFGEADFLVAGIIDNEPDRVGEGFTLGPVAIVSMAGLQRTGLAQPGSLITSKYRLRLPASAQPESVIEDLKERFPASSWEFRDRDRAAPGASRFFERMGQFLGLIGLAALIIAGIGVSNGVGAYLRRKRDGIATMKMLGASSRDIGRVYLLQTGMVTLAAVAAGLVFGTFVQAVVVSMVGDLLPVQPGFKLHAGPLLVSAAYGILMAFIFLMPPLGRARVQPVASLFRETVARRRGIGWRAILTAAVALALIVALAAGTAREPLFTLSVLGAVGASILLLAVAGFAVTRLARAIPSPKHPLVRLAVTGLHRPGSQTVGLVIALGLALTLFVSIAAIQTSLTAEIERTVPKRAPDQFVLDIPSKDRANFETMVRRNAPGADINIVPNLRGTITAYGNTRVADLDDPPPDAWFLRGERGVTYSATLPEGSELAAGEWWPADYLGPPLVSLDREAAQILGIGVGDTLTVTVLGREIVARIASLREVHWDRMGFNYILVFPPSVLQSAPHNLAATIDLQPAQEAGVSRAVLGAFPSVTIVDVGEIITEVSSILRQMSLAILLAGSAAVLAGIAVLIGALAASRLARSYDSIILKTLGATRFQILAIQALEYGLLALVVTGISIALGLTGAWYVIVKIFEFGWSPDWTVVLATLAAGAALTLTIALLSSLPILRLRPATALRTL
jgi:putative ABC transport system permease protein